MNGRSDKPSKLVVARWRRAARRGEAYIVGFEFPPHIRTRTIRHFPELDEGDWELVERGLREWFICSAWRGRTMLGMPSRVVDEAWHQFILDSVAYTQFCNEAFGGYLHHTPDEAVATPIPDTLGNTVRAWDRSGAGSGEEESVLWDLDERLGIEEPLGLDGLQLNTARGSNPAAIGPVLGGCAAGGAWAGGDSGGGGGCGSGGDGGGGASCGSGGGCGGGGCGGS